MVQTLALVPPREFRTPTHYTWSFPGSPIQVRIALKVVARLQNEVESSKKGLLVGNFEGPITQIDDFLPLLISDPPVPWASPNLVGYFRTHHEPELRLNDEDIALATTLLPNPQQVFLLIQPHSGTATFFFWDQGAFNGDIPFLEFPWDPSLLASGEQQRIQTQEKTALAKLALDAPPAPVVHRRSLKRKVFYAALWTMLLAGASAGAVVGLRHWPGKLPLHSNDNDKNNPASPPTAPITVDAAAPIPIGLQAERQNRDLKVTWNRSSAAVRSAVSGILSIEDGNTHRKIILDPAKMQTGSIVYAPTTDEVQLQLTVLGSDTVSETVIVVLPKSGSPEVQTIAEVRPLMPLRPFTPPPDLPGVAKPVSAMLPDAPVALEPPTSIVSIAPGLTNPVMAPPAPARQSPPTVATIAAQTLPLGSAPQPKPATLAPVYYPPAVVYSTAPGYPAELRGLHISVKRIELKVSIDQTGKVVKAEALPLKVWTPQAMVKSALETVHRWKFRPARKGDQAIPSEMILRFDFKSPE